MEVKTQKRTSNGLWINQALNGSFNDSRVQYRYRYHNKVQFKEINPFALACGYVQSINIGNRSLELWKEHSTFHVRYTDPDRKIMPRDKGYREGVLIFQIWDSFNSLTEARKRFKELCHTELPYWYDILGWYDRQTGYEVVSTVSSLYMAKKSLKEYQDNEPGIPFKIKKVKEVE